jgi:transcriptional regulator with XRE-family HTH domain
VTDVTSLGAAIRTRRIAAHLSQAQLSARAGVSRRFVGELESGLRTGAELSRVLAVLKALDLAITLIENEPRSFDDALLEVLG